MDVSNHREKPGQTPVAWLLFLILSLLAANASGFTVSQLGWGASVQLTPDDIAQDGVPLSAATEQVLDEGMLQADLTDFSVPIDVNLGGVLASSTLTASINRTFAFMVRLSRAERDRCVQDLDFDIDLNIVSPISGAFSASGIGLGTMRVVRFEPVYRGAWGRRCPSTLFYGYNLELSVADAVSAGAYEGTAEIAVELSGAGGASQSIQVPLEVQMPGMLLLYHHSQIDVNLDATALAGALGANRACSGGFCMDVGSRSLAVADLSGPVLLNVAADAGTLDPIQTITLRDAVAVRATGCSGDIYDTATYQILNTIGGVQPRNGVINGIQNAPCGLDIRSGDLSFDLDLNQVDAVTGSASATIQITVTGL
jgi:hypothetical protein